MWSATNTRVGFRHQVHRVAPLRIEADKARQAADP
jgi:hypothetical protein